MSVPQRYPLAFWKGDGMSSGSYTSGPFLSLVHTTETLGLPSYSDGRSAPHLTYTPRFHEWTQHTRLDISARSLRNEPGGVQTNRKSVLQVEIVCYSARSVGARRGGLWVADLDGRSLDDIRDFLRWTVEEFGVIWKWPDKQALSYAQANAPGFRLSGPEWDAYDGILGHQHAPENVHWDPGALDWPALMEEPPPPPPPPEEETVITIREGDGVQTDKGLNIVKYYQACINGWLARYHPTRPKLKVDGKFGPLSVTQTTSYQRASQWDDLLDVQENPTILGSIDAQTANLLARFHPEAVHPAPIPPGVPPPHAHAEYSLADHPHTAKSSTPKITID